MRSQIKIYNIVRRIVNLCSYNIKRNKYPDEDIFIKIGKLDKDKKIQEELTLGKIWKNPLIPKF
jgi:hypothetical protein